MVLSGKISSICQASLMIKFYKKFILSKDFNRISWNFDGQIQKTLLNKGFTTYIKGNGMAVNVNKVLENAPIKFSKFNYKYKISCKKINIRLNISFFCGKNIHSERWIYGKSYN